MSNWARSFQDLLGEIEQLNQPKERFLHLAADKLQIDGETREVDSAKVIVMMISRIRRDIDNLNYDLADKQNLEGVLVPFAGLSSLAHAHFTLEQAKGNFLKKPTIQALSSIDYACRNVFEKASIDDDLAKSIEQLKAAAAVIASSDASPEAKFLIAKRLEQVLSILEAFQFYGAEEAQEKLDILVGALVQTAVKEPQNSKILQKMMGAALMLMGALSYSEVGTGHIAKSAENINSAISDFSEIAGFVKGKE